MPLSPPPPPLRPASRPALAMAVLVAAGIAIARAGPEVGPVAWGGLGAGAAVGAVGYALWSRRRMVTLRPLTTALALTVAAVALGAARDAAWRTPAPDAVAHLAARADHDAAPSITLWGTVSDVPTQTWAIRFDADVDSANVSETTGAVSGRVHVSLRTEGAVYPALRPGDRVRLTGALEPLPRPRNPGQMDYGGFLRRQGVGAMLEVRDETGVAFLAPSDEAIARAAESVRRHVRRSLAGSVPSEAPRALLTALILADRSAIERPTLDAFRATGLMHLLAVSGLHVGLVGGALYVVLKPLLGRLGLRRRRVEWTRAAVTLAILGVYVVVAGASVSVVRAFVMVALLIVGRALERPADALNTLGVAALLIVLHRPAALFDVGFQLSFGAVAALVTMAPLMTSSLPERVRESRWAVGVVGSIVTSVAATIGTAPALLAHFGALPLGGLVLNVIAIPLTGVTLGSGIAAVAAAPVPPIATAFGALADVAGRALLSLTEVGALGLGWATVETTLESPTVLAATILAIASLGLWRRVIARRRLMLGAVACLAATAWTDVATGAARPALDVVFLDVGQGDATLVSTPGGRHVLIDAGLRSPYVDEGERTVLPHLDRVGIRRLDALVLTHADADHIGGARSVLEGVAVGRLVVNGREGETELWASVLRAADSLGVPVHPVGAGDTLAVDPSVRVRVLGPDDGLTEPNDASVVLHLQHGTTDWLLTGDAERAGEAALVGRFGALLDAEVVKVGHHGSRTSSTPAFVAAVGRPDVAVVSVAQRNRYGLPDEEPLGRWLATGAEVLLTSEEGAVWLRSDGRTVERVDWRR